MRRLIVVSLCGFVLVVAQSAGAATFIVQMEDFRYVPKVQVIGVGDTVSFHNAGATDHTATTNSSVPGSSSTTVAPGNTSFSTDFFGNRVGAYAYHCQFHPTQMRGVISTTIDVDATSKPLFNAFTLTWSTAPAGVSGTNFDIQVKDPGSDRFVTLVRDTGAAGMTFAPPRRGSYLLRGRFQDPISHTTTGFSKPLKITVT